MRRSGAMAISCGHGRNQPESCSQCLGATPKIVTLDPKSGKLFVDGVALESRTFMFKNPPPRNKKQTGRPRRTLTATPPIRKRRKTSGLTTMPPGADPDEDTGGDEE